MKKIFSTMLVFVVALAGIFCFCACNENDTSNDALNIVFLGDSIAEALIGSSPVSERDNYGYYAIVGKCNGFNYYNHSMSGHLTSGNMNDKTGEGLLEIVSRESESATLIRTHIKQADIIHISILGNNVLQYNLGALMLEMADKVEGVSAGSAESWYQACFDGEANESALKSQYQDDTSLFDYLHDGGSLDVIRPSIWGESDTLIFGDRSDGENAKTKDSVFNFPPSYQNIVDIVAKLRELNPDAKIVFQKVYNPIYEGTTLLDTWAFKALEERGYDTIEEIRALAGEILNYLNGMLDEYNANHPQMQVEILDIQQAFEDVTRSDMVDGKINLSSTSLGRDLMFADYMHPSNFGHAVIACETQKLLEKWGMASEGALDAYKAMKCEQLDRMYSSVTDFALENAKSAVNGATDFYAVTLAYFECIDGYTPIGY